MSKEERMGPEGLDPVEAMREFRMQDQALPRAVISWWPVACVECRWHVLTGL